MELFVLDVVSIIMMITLITQFVYIFALRKRMEHQIERMGQMEEKIFEMHELVKKMITAHWEK